MSREPLSRASRRSPTAEENEEAKRLISLDTDSSYWWGEAKARTLTLIMQRNDLRKLLRETCAVIGQDHICQTRQFDGSDCGRCFSCACGQLRQNIDAALGEPDE